MDDESGMTIDQAEQAVERIYKQLFRLRVAGRLGHIREVRDWCDRRLGEKASGE